MMRPSADTRDPGRRQLAFINYGEICFMTLMLGKDITIYELKLNVSAPRNDLN